MRVENCLVWNSRRQEESRETWCQFSDSSSISLAFYQNASFHPDKWFLIVSRGADLRFKLNTSLRIVRSQSYEELFRSIPLVITHLWVTFLLNIAPKGWNYSNRKRKSVSRFCNWWLMMITYAISRYWKGCGSDLHLWYPVIIWNIRMMIRSFA